MSAELLPMNPSYTLSGTAAYLRFGMAITLFLLLNAIPFPLLAQERESRFRTGGGVAGNVPVTEGNDVNPSWGLRGFLRYAVTERFSLELGVAYLHYVDKQKEYDQLDVEGMAVPMDLRALLALLPAARFRPYLFAGIGVTPYDADREGTHLSPFHSHGTLSGAYVHIPVGIGAALRLSYNWGIEFQAGNNLGLSDGLNPNLDGTDDHLWTGMAGVSYRFGSEELDADLLIDIDHGGNEEIVVAEPDADGDGLGDEEETGRYHSDPMKVDTDADGLNDREEAREHRTDPARADTDGDGLKDGEEVRKHRTNPLKVDTDGDGLTDGAEVITHGTDPHREDTDSDGFSDGEEVKRYGTDPLKAD